MNNTNINELSNIKKEIDSLLQEVENIDIKSIINNIDISHFNKRTDDEIRSIANALVEKKLYRPKNRLKGIESNLEIQEKYYISLLKIRENELSKVEPTIADASKTEKIHNTPLTNWILTFLVTPKLTPPSNL